MKGRMLIGVLALLVAGSLRAQQIPPKVAVGGGSPDDRASARLLYWNVPANVAAGQLAINYGRPVWRKEYEDTAKFDAITKGPSLAHGRQFLEQPLHRRAREDRGQIDRARLLLRGAAALVGRRLMEPGLHRSGQGA